MFLPEAIAILAYINSNNWRSNYYDMMTAEWLLPYNHLPRDIQYLTSCRALLFIRYVFFNIFHFTSEHCIIQIHSVVYRDYGTWTCTWKCCDWNRTHSLTVTVFCVFTKLANTTCKDITVQEYAKVFNKGKMNA